MDKGKVRAQAKAAKGQKAASTEVPQPRHALPAVPAQLSLAPGAPGPSGLGALGRTPAPVVGPAESVGGRRSEVRIVIPGIRADAVLSISPSGEYQITHQSFASLLVLQGPTIDIPALLQNITAHLRRLEDFGNQVLSKTQAVRNALDIITQASQTDRGT